LTSRVDQNGAMLDSAVRKALELSGQRRDYPDFCFRENIGQTFSRPSVRLDQWVVRENRGCSAFEFRRNAETRTRALIARTGLESSSEDGNR